MKTSVHIMLDLETLATEPYALITQIGACYFTDKGEVLSVYEANVSIKDSLKKGFKIDGNTLKWWLERPEQISWLKNTKPITKVIEELRTFCNYNNKICIWSHYFDVMVLEGTCSLLQRKFIFSYRRWRDIRTLVEVGKYLGIEKKKKTGSNPKTHNALEDCFYQVEYVSKILQKIKNINE